MIEATSLFVHAGSRALLHDVSLRIPHGEVSVILGPNGAGKSTLLKCLSGAIQPDAGTVHVNGKPLATWSLNALARARAVLSQFTPIAFPFTVLEIVMMGRQPFADETTPTRDKDIALAALEAVDATHLQGRIFPTLSGGEQQRVQLARVFTQLWETDHATMLLDEPTSALDLKHQHHIVQLSQKWARERNAAVCMILHDIHLAKRYADQCILLRDAACVAAGPTAEVLSAAHIEAAFDIPFSLVSAA